MMRHEGGEHGNIRADFPGGWQGDAVNAFTRQGLTDGQKEIQAYLSKIQNWRKNCTTIHHGNLMHFTPEDGVYTYFRYTENKTVMVVLNKNEVEKQLSTQRFSERLNGFSGGTEIITATKIDDISTIKVPAKSAMIIELTKN
jgi:glycosidase